MASPRYRTGKYSKVLPVKLQQKYSEARANPALLDLRDDIAVCESRLMDLFQRAASGESGALWQALGVTLEACNTALAHKDLPAMHRHLETMRQRITEGQDDYHAWEEIQELWKTRCQLTLTEQKTLVAMQQMVSAEQLMVFMGVITDTIQRAVTTHAAAESARAILQDISTEFARMSTLEAH